MSALLAINVSPRLDTSVSRRLTAKFIEYWNAAHADGRVTMRDLTTTALPFVDQAWIGGAFGPREMHSPEMQAAIRRSDELINEFVGADEVVIGTPMFNFSIPGILKTYIDQIVRVGATVSPNYEGMLSGRKATVIIASGSTFAPGTPWASQNVASPYVQQILRFLGITNVTIVLAGGTRAIDMGQVTMDDFAAAYEEQLREAATGRQTGREASASLLDRKTMAAVAVSPATAGGMNPRRST